MTWRHGQGVQFLGFGFMSGGPFHCLGSALIAGRRQKTSIDLHHFPPTALPPLPSTVLHCLHSLHSLRSLHPTNHSATAHSKYPWGDSMVIFRKQYILPITSTSNNKAFGPIRPALGPTIIIFSYSLAHTLTTCRRRCSLSPAILEVEKTRPLSSRED